MTIKTQAEIAAYNEGVMAVLDLASRSAASIDAIVVLKPTRFNFAVEALRGLAEEGRALLKRHDGSTEVDVTETGPKPLPGGAVLSVAK